MQHHWKVFRIKQGHSSKSIQTPGLVSTTSWALCLSCIALSLVTTMASDVDFDTLTPVRNTTYGKVRGYYHKLKSGQEVERYLGVPYAAPPVADRRFKRPIPPAHWKNIRPATRISPACWQHLLDEAYIREHNPDFDGVMNEDCLYLNIYVPRRQGGQESPSSLLPVLIHVHGGSNEVGMGAMLSGDVLASLGQIIVVTFNYRLGSLGFLSVPHLDIVGNFGLHDQVMAFKWVKDNIAAFGGDPAKVTIQGHSAGSTDVGFHVLSPLTKGLFRYAILMSGSPTAFWALLPDTDSEDKSSGPAHHLSDLGCYDHKDKAEVLTCLQSLAADRLAAKTYNHGGGIFAFAAVVDKEFVLDQPEAFLAKLARTEGARLNTESIMIGVVKDEGSPTAEVMLKNEMAKEERGRYLTLDELMDHSHIDVPDRFDDQIFRTYGAPDVDSFQAVKNVNDLSYYVYKPWNDPHNSTASIIALSDLAGDATFTAPAIHFADLISSLNHSDLYMYRFEHRSELSKYPPWMGVPHGDDLFYLFGCPIEGHPRRNYTSVDISVSLALIDIWANFVKNGRPSYQGSGSLRKYGDDQSYFQITSNATDVVIQNDVRMRARFIAYWNYLLPSLGQIVENSSSKREEVIVWVLTGLLCVLIPLCLIIIGCLICYIKRSDKQVIREASTEETGNML